MFPYEIMYDILKHTHPKTLVHIMSDFPEILMNKKFWFKVVEFQNIYELERLKRKVQKCSLKCLIMTICKLQDYRDYYLLPGTTRQLPLTNYYHSRLVNIQREEGILSDRLGKWQEQLNDFPVMAQEFRGIGELMYLFLTTPNYFWVYALRGSLIPPVLCHKINISAFSAIHTISIIKQQSRIQIILSNSTQVLEFVGVPKAADGLLELQVHPKVMMLGNQLPFVLDTVYGVYHEDGGLVLVASGSSIDGKGDCIVTISLSDDSISVKHTTPIKSAVQAFSICTIEASVHYGGAIFGLRDGTLLVHGKSQVRLSGSPLKSLFVAWSNGFVVCEASSARQETFNLFPNGQLSRVIT